jgi:hypothetical protein
VARTRAVVEPSKAFALAKRRPRSTGLRNRWAVPDSAAFPRIMTGSHPRAVGTYGSAAKRWILDRPGLHKRAMPNLRWWQELVLARVAEHDESGALVWRTVIVSGPRQVGKSVLERGVCSWRIHQERIFREPQDVLHVAHKLSGAREVWQPAGRWAAAAYGRGATRWASGEEQIELPDHSRWMIQAANDGAGVSFSLSMVLVDEAWRVSRGIVENALEPTLAESSSPQLWLVSTAGTSTSDLMAANRAAALATEQPGEQDSTLLIEWSAPPDPDLDIGDPATWRTYSPHWDERREDTIRDAWGRVNDEQSEYAFRQQWLNQWIPSLTKPLIDAEAWARLSTPQARPSGPLAFGVDEASDRSRAVIVAFGGGVLEVVEDQAGTAWLPDRLVELVDKHKPVAIGIDGTGPAGAVAAQLAGTPAEPLLVMLTGREMANASAIMFDRVQGRRIRARQHVALDAAVHGARWRTYGQARTWQRDGPVSGVPLIAGTAAVWAHEHAVAPVAPFRIL